MRFRIAILTAVMLLVLAVAVAAQVNVIPRNTVIPVIIENSISSATSNIGDRFTSYCQGTNCGGFPMNTRFVGTVTSVTRAGGGIPGQVGVSFDQAILPDGRTIPISGMLTSLDPNAITVDPATGLMTGRPEAAPDRNKFIGYGAGAGLVIGAITGNTLQGGLIGAAAGWLYGSTLGRGQRASDVSVPAGTQFGIMLTRPVRLGEYRPPVTIPPTSTPGRGPEACPRELLFAGTPAPYLTDRGIAMVPAKATLDALGIRFRYNVRNQRVVINTSGMRVTHDVGTDTAMVNGREIQLSAPSRTSGGSLFLPTDFISVLTGRPVTWSSTSQSLFIY